MDKSRLRNVFLFILSCLCYFFSAIFLSGCQNTLIEEPNILRSPASGSATTLSVPGNVTATQGGFETVTVTWTGCNAASRYYVYSAESTYDLFEQCGETKGNVTTLTITEPAGTTKYYRVSAVKYDGTQSALSNWAKGTTISKPVITSLTSDESNNIFITWWMDNCNQGTYQNKVWYLIQGKKGTASSASISVTIDGSSGIDTYTFNNLEGKTEYQWTVSAYTVTGTAENPISTKPEVSSSVSVTTAHRLIPIAPVDFAVTKGTSKSDITVSWKAPAMTDIENEDGTYTEKANFFVIYKKLASSDDSAYQVAKVYTWNGQNRTINDVSYPTQSFSTYTEGMEFAYTDSPSNSLGIKFDYKVKVFVDIESGTSKTSSRSEATDSGWLIAKPSFSTGSVYSIDPADENKLIECDLSFSASFDSMGMDNTYSYVLVENRKDLATDSIITEGWPKIIGKSSALTTCCRPKSFTDMQQSGYYRYSLYIIPRITSESDYDNYASTNIISCDANGKVTITDDANAMPNLNSVTIDDGFKDCYKLNWLYDKDCTYTLTWTNNFDKTGTYTLTSKDVKNAVHGETFTFVHKGGTDDEKDPAVISGEMRLYTVTANKGLTKSVTADNYSKTLGTAVPEMIDNDYSSITIRWPLVQKADSYIFTAKYKDSGNNCTFTSSDEEQKEIDGVTYVYYTLSNIQNYSDASVSGLPISFKVTAKNNSSLDTTDGTTEICNLGPAETSPSITGTYKNYIEYKWKKANGAKGYLIHRGVKFYSGDNWKDSTNSINYYISANCETIEAEGTAVSSDCATVTFDSTTNTYTLIDKYYETSSETPGKYDFSQSTISWGVPFTYYVVPVKNSKSDFVIDTTAVPHKIKLKTPDKTYTNLVNLTGSTYGYGQNVLASKSDSDSDITVEWTKPFKTDYAPNIYYRKAGSSDNKWNRLMKATPAANDTKITFNFETYFSNLSDYSDNSKYESYEYAVAYYTTQQTGYEFAASFVKDSENSGLGTIESTENPRYEYASGISPEKQNKGYLLKLKPFTAQYGGTETENLYREMLNWQDWNFEERGIGPLSYKIYVKNKNFIHADSKDDLGNSGWVHLLTLDTNCRASNFEAEKTAALAKDITLDIQESQLTIDVTSLTAGTSTRTDGLLKVLRDARHYYEIVASNASGKTSSGSDESIFAYRQITKEEAIKAAMLGLTDGLYQIGKFDFESEEHKDGNNLGKVTGKHNASFQIGKEYGITYENYCALLKSPYGDNVSMLKINSTLTGYRNSTTSGSYPKSFDSALVNYEPYYDDMPSSYKGSFTFAVASEKSATISSGNFSPTINTTDLRRSWVPFYLYSDSAWYHENTKYGWWPTN